jgi:hypothetical protein
MEHEYVIYVETSGDPENERYTYKCERELTEGQVIKLDGRQVVIVEVVERPRLGYAGLAEADPFQQIYG